MHSQRLETVGRLAGGIAHDFNNLLAVVGTSAELVMHEVPVESPARADLREITKAVRRAAELTQQLLAFSRKQILQPANTNLNDIVHETERLLRRTLGEDISLVTDLTPRLHRVFVDPGQIQQVLVNLAVNARDAMPEGGTLTIETANVRTDSLEAHPTPTDRTNGVCLSVSDTGSGMTDEVRERIFEPFFTTKLPGKGTGLGLSTVHGIVEQSGGRIVVGSQVGVGTTFALFFSAVQAPKHNFARNESTVPPKGMGEWILVVDDDEVVGTTAAKVLRAAGYRAWTAKGGRQALEIVEQAQERIALLLTDVVMPEMTGPQLADEVQRRSADIKVLFMSGYPDDPRVEKRVAASKASFVGKPFTSSQLIKAVWRLLAAGH